VIERSPADVLRLVLAAILLLVLLVGERLFGNTLVAFASDLLRGLDAVPRWMVEVVVVGTRLLSLVLLGGLLVVALARRRWRLLATITLAAAAATALVALLDDAVDTTTEPALVELGIELGPLTTSGFASTAGIAAVAGILTAAAPWLRRAVRRAGWALILGLMVSAAVVAPLSTDSLLAITAGWLSGAAVLVALGAPTRRPTMDAVVGGLAAAGVPVQHLERAGVDARGSTPYFGVDTSGSRLFVKALGADERSADLLFRLYRRVLPRDFGDQRPFLTLQRAVEHEAFVALAARAVGVRTPAVRAVAGAEPDGYVLAYEAIEGRSLDRVDPSEVTDDVLESIWLLVADLRRHRLAHRDLRLANIFLGAGGDVWLIDFGFGEVVASDLLLATDVAELLASSSVRVGAARAVAPAARTVDRATLERAHGRLQRWALSGATRTAHKEQPALLPALRAALAEALDTGPSAGPDNG